jgi:2-polyprenyl-6-methoxyphenol hydroxylase-like FAD-dependent oxidoreductase
VGAGPTGLTTALLLAHYGAACTVVERRPEPSRTPRARAVTLRTMEVLRTLGLAEEASAAAVASERIGLPFTFAPTLAEATPARTTTMVRRGVRAEQSPCTTVMCPQDVLERILLARIAATRFIPVAARGGRAGRGRAGRGRAGAHLRGRRRARGVAV